MASFTKEYRTEPTQKQREAMNRAARASVNYWVNEENRNVIMIVDEELRGDGIVVSFFENVEGCTYNFPLGVIFIGNLGGIKSRNF